MLVYKINRDTKAESDRLEIDFKTTLFASNPELFNELYATENKEGDFEIEEILPQSEDDVQKMMAQLKREGVIK